MSSTGTVFVVLTATAEHMRSRAPITRTFSGEIGLGGESTAEVYAAALHLAFLNREVLIDAAVVTHFSVHPASPTF